MLSGFSCQFCKSKWTCLYTNCTISVDLRRMLKDLAICFVNTVVQLTKNNLVNERLGVES